jgi:flagellum-specific peptidoglycan hydrolase FlgJ
MNLSPAVVADAQAAMRRWKPFASIQIVQYGLESGWGAKVTGRFNYFGVQAAHDAEGKPIQPFTLCASHEFLNGRLVPKQEAFADYVSPAEAFMAHAELLATHPAYAAFMARVAAGDVHGACNALTGVYATAPFYGETLWSIIQGDNLTQYDKATP